VVGSILMAGAALIAVRIGNTRVAGPVVMVNTQPGSGLDPAVSTQG
jgi:hypothetical protein